MAQKKGKAKGTATTHRSEVIEQPRGKVATASTVRAAMSSAIEDADIVLRPLAILSLGFSGADIERLVRDVRNRVRRAGRHLTYGDLDAAIAGNRPQRSPGHRRVIAVHEAGHAVLRHVFDEGTIEFVSIDGASGGMTVGVGRSEVMTEERMQRWLAVDLAGRAAEDVILGEITAGSGGSETSDLAKATKLALGMETQFGFGERPFLHADFVEKSHLLWADPHLAARVHERLERAYDEACRMVRENRERIERLADALLVAGTLDGETVSAIIAE